MGMQCHFNVKDLPNFKSNPSITYDFELESYSYQMPKSPIWQLYTEDWSVDCDIKGNAWFDIGSITELQMAKIKYLIANRICFTCS